MGNFNNRPVYLFTYGDEDANNERISDYVVKVVKSERFQRHMGSVCIATMAVASHARPVSAIPPEYWEAAANIAEGAGQAIPPLGDVAGTANPMQGVGDPGRVHLPGQYGTCGYVPPNQNHGGPNFDQLPQQPFSTWKLPGPPMTPKSQYVNTFLIISSVGWICLNASWGNTILVYGCIGIVGGVLNELRKYLK